MQKVTNCYSCNFLSGLFLLMLYLSVYNTAFMQKNKTNNQKKWYLQLYCYLQPRTALELACPLARTTLNSTELTHTLSFTLSRSLELAHSFARRLASIQSNSLSLKLSVTRLPGSAKSFSFHSSFVIFLK